MNYYYEINLNFDEKAYLFYEVSIKDKIEYIKKIPLIKVKTDVLKNIYLYDFKIDDNTYEFIKGKTFCKNNPNLKDACIFCDTKNAIAIEFSNDKNSISRSSLSLEDENNICEIAYSLKCKDVSIEKTHKLGLDIDFRQERNIKKLILLEIDNLYNSKNTNKLKYLYYEWFSKKSDNIDKIKKEMVNDINDRLKDIHLEIYNIIKLSYNKSISN